MTTNKVCRDNSCDCGRSFKDNYAVKQHVAAQERSKHSMLLRKHPAYEMIDWDACALAGITKSKIDSMKIGNRTISLHWLCKEAPCGCEHPIFKTPAQWIVQKRKCKDCSRNANFVCIHRSMAHTTPDLAAQWHPTKNGDRSAENTPLCSTFRATWVCEEGHEWTATPHSRNRYNSGCPDCSATSLEQAIQRVLTNMGIKFKTQARIAPEQTRGGYDIGFTDSKVLIEVDGQQHFHLNEYFAVNSNKTAEEILQATVKRDVMKELLARKHGYHLLRIPYTHASEAAMTDAVKFFLQKLKQHEGEGIKQFEMKVNGQLYLDSRSAIQV